MKCCLTILITPVKDNFFWILGNAVYAKRNVTPIISGGTEISCTVKVLLTDALVSGQLY